MQKLKVEYVSTEELRPYQNNAKIHTDEQIDQIARSIEEFGMNDPIAVWNDNEIIEGHGRLMACQKLGITEVPIIRLDGLTDEQRRAYMNVHNQLTMNTGFDLDLLNAELGRIENIDMSLFGFNIAGFVPEEDPEPAEDDYTEPEELDPIVKRGERYALGDHVLMCGDSTIEKDVMTLLSGMKADLVFTDPPYGMKKEKDGVLNDNLNYDDLLEFNKKWIPLSFRVLKENGSWYCWGIDEPLMDIYSNILKPMQKKNEITFRNLITWKKESDNPTMIYNGACSSNNRSYYTNEKCLFVMCGVQGFNNNQDNYFDGWEPVRKYLADEAEKVGLTPKKLQEITGVGMFSRWFGKSQFALITEEHYKQLQEYYNKKEYDVFKKEYDVIKKEYYATRAYFDGDAGQCVDVWVHDVTSQAERKDTGGHATPKPVGLCAKGIKTSSKEGDVVLDLFGGSGSTLIAAEQLGRKCYMMEYDPHYCDVIIDRWEKFTGKQAVLIDD